jgi:hypothetical protein
MYRMAKKVVLFMAFYLIWIAVFVAAIMSQLGNGVQSVDMILNYGANGTIALVVGSIVVCGAPIIIFLYFFYRTPRWEKEVQETGRTAPAQVLEVRNTGVGTGSRYNPTMYYRLKLRVQPPGDEPFEATLEKPLSVFGVVSPGSVTQVKYDPNNKRHVVIAHEAASGSGYASTGRRPVVITTQGGHASQDLMQFVEAAISQAERQTGGVAPAMSRSDNNDIAEQLMNLSELRRRGELTDSEFEAAKKKLLA